MLHTNYLAVLIAAIVGMVLGYLWYGPIFGTEWTRLMGWSKAEVQKRVDSAKGKAFFSYALLFAGLLLMAFTLSRMIALITLFTGVAGVTAGLEAAFLAWFGFVVPSSMGAILWEDRLWRLWLLNSSYYLVTLLLMGIVVGTWV